MARCTQRTLRRWVTRGHLTRHTGPQTTVGPPPVLVSVRELRAYLAATGKTPEKAQEPTALAPTGAAADRAPDSAGQTNGGDGEEKTLADQLRDDLRVAQKVIQRIEDQLDEGEEQLPGRTIMALGTLIKTTSALKEKIAALEAQRPRGPRTEEDARRTLRLAMEGWDDQALELAFEVYRERHTRPMEGRVCRITLDDGQGHQAVWDDGRWLAVAS